MIPFPSKLIKGQFLKRYRRFFVDVRLEDGSIVTAHCPNTGSMKSCFVEGCDVYLSRSDDPKRKLPFTLELSSPTSDLSHLVGVNTMMPNRVVGQWLEGGGFARQFSAREVRREVPFGKSTRFDFLLENDGGEKCFLEVKNTTFMPDESVAFPDAVTERGQKHLDELIHAVEQGHGGALVFFVNRTHGEFFRPAAEIDRIYAEKLQSAVHQGVKILALRARLTLDGIGVSEEVRLKL